MIRAILMTSLLPVLLVAADFTVGSATARSGQKATGYIVVSAGVDAAASIPVIVVNGARPGPRLALASPPPPGRSLAFPEVHPGGLPTRPLGTRNRCAADIPGSHAAQLLSGSARPVPYPAPSAVRRWRSARLWYSCDLS